MTLVLSKALLRDIGDHAEEGYPNEVCGFLVGPWDGQRPERLVDRVRRAPNAFAGPKRTRFAIHPKEVMDLEEQLDGSGKAILGFYHSHPDAPAAPSVVDEEQAWPWYSYVVVSVMDGRFAHATSWVLREDRSAFDEETVVVR